MGGAVLKDVCDIPNIVTISARQANEAMIQESQHIWKTFPYNHLAVYHYSSLQRGVTTQNTEKE